MQTVGVTANDITYVLRLIKNKTGLKHLFDKLIAANRISVKLAHINAIK